MKSAFIKLLIFHVVILLFQPIASFAQYNYAFKMDENIIGEYFKPDPSYMKRLERLRGLSMKWETVKKSKEPWTKVSGKPKKIKELVFKMDGRTLYTTDCKVAKYSRVILPTTDIRYKNNDQLFCSEKDIADGKINKDATLYNEDGSPLYQETKVLDGSLLEVVSYKSKDEIVFKFQAGIKGRGGTNKWGPFSTGYLYDKHYYNERIISSYAQEAALIPLADSNRYVGFSHVGTLHTQEHGDIKGYFFPHQRRSGNGSVFFRELDEKKEWVLIIDGEIEMAVPANADDEPELADLLNNLTNNISFSYMPNLPDGTAKNIYRKPHVGTYRTDNIDSHNGYGVNYYSQDSVMSGDKRFLEVGIFKNGKLHGIGYRCKMTSVFDPESKANPNPVDGGRNSFGVVQEKVYAEAGVFENGELKEGRVIDIENDNNVYRNYYTKDKIASVDYVMRYNYAFKSAYFTKAIPLSEIPPNAEIYVKALDTRCHLGAPVDLENKTLRVNFDGDFITLDKDSGPLYQYVYSKQRVAYDCPKTKTVKNYEWKDKTVSHPITAYDTRVVTGTEGKIVYSRKIKNASFDVTYKVKQMNGYKSITCPICEGSGKKYANQGTELYMPISFE